MQKRQQEGESMGTPAQVEAVIALLTAAHPDQPADGPGCAAGSDGRRSAEP